MKTSHQSDIAIKLQNISKKYEIHHEKPTLVEKFVKARNETFWALKNINLTIKKGDKIGILGPNGSGKTTLLKIITGISTPTTGQVSVYGKIISLIDLEAGFHEDLTGEQNIFLNGMLLGMNKKIIQQKVPNIIAYADLKQFIDAPLLTYSTGMKLRLGFAIVINSDPDILVLDEGLQVGDESFRRKSDRSIIALLKKNKTLVTVTHNFNTIRNHCNRVLILDKGAIAAEGDANLVKYYKKNYI